MNFEQLPRPLQGSYAPGGQSKEFPMRFLWNRYAVIGLTVAMMLACAQTDAGITTAVKTRLAADDTVKAYQIDVDTRDKVVTLSGSVNTAAEKTQAAAVARGTDGVVNVVDNITLKVPAEMARPVDTAIGDAALTAAVKTKLLADPKVSGLKIDVDTKNGMVTLTGTVRSQAEKDEALRLARETENVRNVTDQITVAP
jgi:hyperosmotically inducible periplasmic protein